MEELNKVSLIKDHLEAILLAMNTSKDHTKIANFLLNKELTTALDSLKEYAAEKRTQIHTVLFNVWLYFVYLPADLREQKAQTSNELTTLIEDLTRLQIPPQKNSNA